MPTLAEASRLSDLLKSLEVDGHQRFESLDIFHLRWTAGGNGSDYLTLDGALEAGCIHIAESSAQGSVPQITITNRSPRMIFLMAGEQLVGCKQNRVLNTSIMVGANTETPLPVTCVEGGRWGYTSQAFFTEHSSSHHHLRAMMAAQATRSYKTAGAPHSDQAAVWGEVARKLDAMGSRSPSSELQAMYRDHNARLADVGQNLPAPAGRHGAVFCVAGKIMGADIFDKPETLRKLWPKLVRSSAIDSFEASKNDAKPISIQEVAAWVGRSAGLNQNAFPSPGVGQDFRLEGQDLFGAALVLEDGPVHVELFASRENRQHWRPHRPSGQTPDAGGSEAPAGSRTWKERWRSRIFRRKAA